MKDKFDSTPNKPHEAWKGVEWWEEGYEELWAEPTPSSSSSGAEIVLPTPVTPLATTEAPVTTEAPSTTTPSIPPISIGSHAGQPRSRVPKSSIIYLTGDSPNVLTTIEEGKTYILGGIVDRNRYKKLCFDKAEQHGIQHAQLPIGQYMPDMPTRKVLTVNQVGAPCVFVSHELAANSPLLLSLPLCFHSLCSQQVYDILLQFVETQSWSIALQAVMPTRKMEHGGPGGRKGRRGGKEGELGEGEEGEDGEEELLEEAEGEGVYEVKSDGIEVEGEKQKDSVEAASSEAPKIEA
jgi:tRNA (guanine9-N1)-methyltransferase